MRWWGALVVLLICYVLVLNPLVRSIQARPLDQKAGVVPNSGILKALSADHQGTVAAGLVLKALVYFGGHSQRSKRVLNPDTDYEGIQRLVETTVQLDPYNMDAYYFAQALLTWDMKKPEEANRILDHGMKYRTWDWYLPFFAGFNAAYFMKDYDAAAGYFQKAGEMTGSPRHIGLAGQYLHESGRTSLAVGYLKLMEMKARNPAIKKNLKVRRILLERVLVIEKAVQQYQEDEGALPQTVEDLQREGYLARIPRHPLGGGFRLDKSGNVEALMPHRLKEIQPEKGDR